MEEWKPVDGFADYEVSNEGRVRRAVYCVMKPQGYRGKDYPRIKLYSGNGKYTRKFVHALVARAFIGECPEGYEHNHKDGNKHNARVENLEFVTKRDNEHHKHAVLGYPVNRGSDHGRSKLSDTEVVRIRRLSADGMKAVAIARIFGVRATTISAILTRKTWRHLI